jgi:putative ABC transport system substrate-binding protein
MARKLLLVLIVALTVVSFGIGVPTKAQKKPTIGFMQLVSHPALDAGRIGAVESLKAAGFEDGTTATFIFANAENDIPTLATIAQSFLDKNVDLIIATSTPALQAAYKATQSTEGPPVVFNVVTSPYAAGAAEAPCRHPKWVIGTQALAPYAETMPLIFQAKPDAKVVGYIYNPAEANSVANTKIITPLAEKLGLKLEIQTIANTSEVKTAAEALVSRKIDVFYVATDSTVVAGFEALVKVANDNKIPLIASDPASSRRGAVIAQGLDYLQEGRDAGRIAVAILQGKLDISKTKIIMQKTNQLAVNLDAAEAQGVKLPEDLLAKANNIFKGGEDTVKKAVATISAAQMAEADAAFMKALVCTPEELAATAAPTQAK